MIPQWPWSSEKSKICWSGFCAIRTITIHSEMALTGKNCRLQYLNNNSLTGESWTRYFPTNLWTSNCTINATLMLRTIMFSHGWWWRWRWWCRFSSTRWHLEVLEAFQTQLLWGGFPLGLDFSAAWRMMHVCMYDSRIDHACIDSAFFCSAQTSRF